MNDSPPLPSGPLKLYAAAAKGLLWLLAAAWLLLALAWGAVHGWIVPRIGELRPSLETQATRLLGVPVRIGAVSAHSEGLVPSLQLESVVLLDPQGREALRLPRINASLSPRSLLHLGFDQLYIDAPVLDVRRSADGRLFVAGLELSQGQGPGGQDDGRAADWFFRQGEFVIRGGTVRWTDEMRPAPPLQLENVDLVVRNTARRHSLRLDATPPTGWGDRFTVQGVFRRPLLSAHPGRWQDWDGQLHADFRRVDLAELRKHARPGIEVHGGRGAVRAWLDVANGQVTGGVADLSAADVSTTLGEGLAPLSLSSVSGRLGGRRLPGGMELEAKALQFTTAEGQHWPAGDVFLSWTEPDGRREGAGELRADRLDLGTLGQLAGRVPLGRATHAALTRHAPQGVVENLQAQWQGALQQPAKYKVKGKVAGLQLASVPASVQDGKPVAATPGLRNAALDFDLTESGGKARVALNGGALELPDVFQDPVLEFDRLSGDVQWQVAGERISVSVAHLRFANADAQGEAQASWRTGDQAANRFPGVLELQGSLSRANGGRVWRYLPLGVPQDARDYVRESVQQAEVSDARFRVRGDLKDFPFPQRQGEFLVTAQVKNAHYAFAPKAVVRGAGPLPWPALSQLSGKLVFDRSSLRVEDAQGRFAGAPNLRVNASAHVADLAHTVVNVDGQVRGPLAEALSVVQKSPVSSLMNDALARASASGNTTVKLGLALPISQIDRSRVQGTVTLPGNDVQITPDSPPLQRARGSVLFSERGFQVVGAQARALGGDVRVEGGSRTGGPAEPSVVLRAQGTATAEGLRQARELGFVSQLARQATGGSSYAAVLSFRRGKPEVLVTSSLQGLALGLPAPLSKSAEAALPLRYENVLLPESAGPAQDQLSVELGRVASVTYVRDLSGAEPRVLRGAIAIGLAPGESAQPPDRGVAANVRLDATSIDAWERALEGGAAPAPAAAASRPAAPVSATAAAAAQSYLPTTVALRARELTVEGRTLHNLVVGGSRDGLLWRGNVDADELNGYVEYRQSSGAGAGRVHARLARLSLAASTTTAVETLLTDDQPGSLPALDVVVEDFELRGRKLGRLEIDAVNRGGGAVVREGGIREWRLNKLALTTPEGSFSATGNWAAVDAQAVPPGGPRPPRTPPERRRTVMNFRLDMADAGQLLGRFGMADVIRRGQGRMEGQVAWLGSPMGLDYPSMQGYFHVDVQGGQFLKADPGLAKLLGVLSLQSLPRRLALDFRDVFSQGFTFDFVRGDITIQNGVAATNNLQMKGVNAAVLMEGKADIARETQDLRVVVVPEINAGTASLVAAAINPAIGLGTFLAQVFLREPLARAATQQFQIDGTWADPRVTKLARQGPNANTNSNANPGAEPAPPARTAVN
jgi:uncharacterized protein (TIGR02099 family)